MSTSSPGPSHYHFKQERTTIRKLPYPTTQALSMRLSAGWTHTPAQAPQQSQAFSLLKPVWIFVLKLAHPRAQWHTGHQELINAPCTRILQSRRQTASFSTRSARPDFLPQLSLRSSMLLISWLRVTILISAEARITIITIELSSVSITRVRRQMVVRSYRPIEMISISLLAVLIRSGLPGLARRTTHLLLIAPTVLPLHHRPPMTVLDSVNKSPL